MVKLHLIIIQRNPVLYDKIHKSGRINSTKWNVHLIVQTGRKTIKTINGRFVSSNENNKYEKGFTSGRKRGACPENLKWWSWTFQWSRDQDFQVQCVGGKISCTMVCGCRLETRIG